MTLKPRKCKIATSHNNSTKVVGCNDDDDDDGDDGDGDDSDDKWTYPFCALGKFKSKTDDVPGCRKRTWSTG